MAGDGTKPRVLIVEDDGFVAMDLDATLAAAGWQVVGPAGSVDRALRLAADEPLDAALLDVNLRGRSSFPVAEALAARRVPFVFLTAYHDPAPPPSLAGAPLLRKPCRRKAILAALVATGAASPRA